MRRRRNGKEGGEVGLPPPLPPESDTNGKKDSSTSIYYLINQG